MATLDNLYERIDRLIRAERIYYSQPTPRLRAALERAASEWTCTNPNRPWGEGPNEDIASMMRAAAVILYGIPVEWEHIDEYQRRGLPLGRLLEVYDRTRSGSLYAVTGEELAEWLLTRPVVPVDERDIWRAVNCRDLPLPVCDDALRMLAGIAPVDRFTLAEPLHWLCLRNRNRGCWHAIADLPALAGALRRHDVRLRRPLTLACQFYGGDLAAAEQLTASVYFERRPLEAMEVIVNAGEALLAATR